MYPAVLPLRGALLALVLGFARLHGAAEPVAASVREPLKPSEAPTPASDAPPASPAPVPEPDAVILLHGLGLNRLAMTRLACALRRDGYRVINVSYSSRRVPLETLAGAWLPGLLRTHKTDTAPRVHFVTHSMGGILLRLHLRDHNVPNLGRIVMIAPPNHGSEVTDHLRKNPLFRLFTGLNGRRLGTDAASLPQQLGPLDADLGIIAGRRSLNPVFSSWIGRPNDGKVSVESTRLAGMKDHLVVPISHTWLQYRSPVITQVKTFLRTGKFQHPTP